MAKHNPGSRKKTPEELSGFCAQVAMMLRSGMPLHDGMEALAQSYAGSPMEADYARVSALVIETGALRDALEATDGYVQERVTELVISTENGCTRSQSVTFLYRAVIAE